MPTRRSILIVDDDAGVREILADRLADEHGFTIFTAETLDEAEAIIADAGRRLDALILEIGLPDGDGRDFCAKLRRQGHGMPILILTDRNDEADIVSGLGCGANDYIAKPFRLNELLARLRAQLRLFDSSGEAAYSIGPYTFQPAKKLLQNPVKNRRVRLTTKEVAILQVPLSLGWLPGGSQDTPAGGVGLRCDRDDAQVGDTHLPAAPEDRVRSERSGSVAHRAWRLSSQSSHGGRRRRVAMWPRRVHAATVDWNATSAIWFRP